MCRNVKVEGDVDQKPNLPASCMAVASMNWKASWTSGGWMSRRKAKAWRLGGSGFVLSYPQACLPGHSGVGVGITGGKTR